jgi:hypothetical protein
MAKLYDLARVFTSTGGTGTITLGAAVPGFLTFANAGAANGDVISYAISDGANSEIGTGTYTAAGTTLTRTVTRSTNSNNPINLSGINVQVFITLRAEDMLLGTTTNDNAAAGYIGEYISSTVLIGAEVTLTNATPANVTSISLTAGDWDVSGQVSFDPAGTTQGTVFAGGINTVSATLPTAPGAGAYFLNTDVPGTAGTANYGPVGVVRISISTTTTVYLVAQSNFTVSTMKAYGFIGARRSR